MSEEKKEYVVPETNALAVPDADWLKYLASQEPTTRRTPSPCGIKFHGDTGKYSLSYYDSATKETKFLDLSPWSGVILAVRWFAKWKYDPDAGFDIRTKEFSLFRDEPVTLIKIDRKNRDKAPEEKSYYDYAGFKAACAMPIPMSDKVKYPFDLFASVYVYAPHIENPVNAEVFRYRFSGTTRSAFFDYIGKGTGINGVMTNFGASEPQKMPTVDKDSKEKVYFTGTFTSSEIPVEMRRGVMEAHKGLTQWFNSWKQKSTDASEVQSVPSFSDGTPLPEMELPVKNLDEDTTDVSSIPF